VGYPGEPGVSNFPFRHSPSLGWWKVFKGYFPVGFASRFCGEIRWTPATMEGYLPGVAGEVLRVCMISGCGFECYARIKDDRT